MKKSLFTFGLAAGMILPANLHAQVTVSNNTAGGGNYVGWENTVGVALEIRHNANQSINFFTNNTQRMTILGSNGFVGIGTATPSSLLQLNSSTTGDLFRTDGSSTLVNRWQLITGGAEKFRLYVPANSNNVFLRTSMANSNFLLQTGGGNNRMKINGIYGPGGYTQYSIGLYNAFHGVNTTGYLLLSDNPSSAHFNDNNGAWSMLHLNEAGGSVPNAYRPWMKIGTTYTAGGDIGYIGYRVLQPDRTEMTIAWGDDPDTEYGPDDMVFRFVGWASAGNAYSVNSNNTLTTDLDGRHIARFTPQGNMGLGPNFGWQWDNSYIAPTQRLDVEGNARFRNVPVQGGESLILGLQQGSNSSDIVFSRLAFPNDNTQVLLGDGTWGTATSGNGFIECSDTTASANLNNDSKINLNNHNFYFENNDMLGQNHVGIGYDCSEVLPGKLSTIQSHPQTVNTNTIAVHTINEDVANAFQLTFTGTYSEVNGMQSPSLRTHHIAGDFKATNATNNYAIIGDVIIPNNAVLPLYSHNVGVNLNVIGPGLHNIGADMQVKNGTSSNVGVSALAQTDTQNGFSSSYNTGGFFSARNAQNTNIGVNTEAFNGMLSIGTYTNAATTEPNGSCFGVYSRAMQVPLSTPETYPASVAIGVYAHTDPISGSLTGYAGFFDGNVWINGPSNGTDFAATLSDSQFKTDVNDQTSADSILRLIQPKTFYFDTTNTYGLNFSSSLQHGMIAQEVEHILPELVSNKTKPAMVDSLGNIIIPSVNYKTLNYGAFVPLLIAGHKEQNGIIDSLQNEITTLNERLSHLESCLSGILPFLCKLSQQSIEQNGAEVQEQLRHIIDVELNNGQAIVLNQNVPNPFAESTVISYSIPESVQTAQLIFHDATGSLIKTVDIRERGEGQINVYAHNLSTGTYTYSLVADDKIVATKRMVKQ